MISVKSMRYVYASVVVGSLIGGYAMMSLVEKLNQVRRCEARRGNVRAKDDLSCESKRWMDYAGAERPAFFATITILTRRLLSSQNRTDSDPSFRRRQLTPAERELAEQQRAAILQMRKRAKEATWQENLSAASAATAEFMVPPSVRAEQQREKDWEERSRGR